METKRTIVYVDGSNLYYGLLRGTAYKWLDINAFAKKLLLLEYRIDAIKYFASRVVDKTDGHLRSERQARYFDALSAQGIQIFEGYYRVRVERLEAAERPCKSCGLLARPGYVRGIRTSEKLTDVNMATELLKDAYENKADAFVLISGDADFAPALRVVRYSTEHSVIVFNPQSSICNELRRYATFYKNIPAGFCDGCRLPDTIETSDGRTIRCPAAWMPGRTGDS